MALTVGVGTVMEAREVAIIITGPHKALALAKCIEEGKIAVKIEEIDSDPILTSMLHVKV